ncbi:hypothetical protein LCGC14_0762120 [marine sediment metagenome]|uniref:Uncharacterized protein n=1 Tax=marine sediment metagenome TaxID=412755 RepID=A0A0F9QKM9_9ZZZZ
MGTLSCQRCGAQAEGNTQKEADDKIDHARGQMIGRPCSGKQSDLRWTDSQKREERPEIVVAENITESKKFKKTIKKSKRG